MMHALKGEYSEWDYILADREGVNREDRGGQVESKENKKSSAYIYKQNNEDIKDISLRL